VVTISKDFAFDKKRLSFKISDGDYQTRKTHPLMHG
jgi:hypothetical protein